QGKPLRGGNVMFFPDGGGSYSSPISPDGTYEITDVPIGTMAVAVETESVNPGTKIPVYGGDVGAKQKAERTRVEGKGGAGFKAQGGEYRKIPQKYTNPKTSPLTVTLEAGRNVKELNLTD